jgi:molybdopterin-guanine dinucleotide biosynthesis protein A
LVRLTAGHDAVVPDVDGHLQPMLAVYRVAPCRAAIRAALARGDRRMISFLDDLRTRQISEDELRAVDPALRSFFNVNTPADLDTARSLLA